MEDVKALLFRKDIQVQRFAQFVSVFSNIELMEKTTA